MEQHGTVAFVADQNAGTKGMFVDFFGRKASTYKSIGLLAMEYEVPIIVGYARRVDDRFRFRVGSTDIIWPKDWKSRDDPLRYITQRYTSAIEAFVRDDPGQYLWVHRRWKTRPKGEKAEAFD
jgi:KDO2-lipid IV(A) lauroyltransferase